MGLEALRRRRRAGRVRRQRRWLETYLPVSALQNKLFAAIDGQRTIAEIAPQAAQRDAARVLFEGLWWYDPVVFDASTRPCRKPTERTHAPTP
jgi:hypothetical protein